ncbi:MAG: class I SAM-dependent RNA methyltransferase [Ignavibacteriales bacterium]|nr:class I SAM-dependent RNA methyltransferase [Ignavibacteriales bacterium]
MYRYQEDQTFFAQAPGQMEELCAAELRELGATDVEPVYRGVYFKADISTLCRVNYCARMLSRVLAPLKEFQCVNPGAITRNAAKINWEDFMSVDTTFAITSTVTQSRITNSLYAAQVLKDVIADHFTAYYGRRPDVDTKNPDIRFNLHIEKELAVLSLDTSGESLHKRGYRLLAGEAPMQETLAAAIVRLSQWDGETPLWDCMCGSGTILCEALMSYCRIPAQYLRKKFGFFNLPEFKNFNWPALRDEINSKMRELPENLIYGSDKSQRTIEVAIDNLSRLPGSRNVHLSTKPFSHQHSFENGTLITNPPYGIRLGEIEEVEDLYTELGDFLKNKCKGTTAFIYTGDPALRKKIGLRTSMRVPLVNGKLEGVLVKIESYEGSKKAKYRTENTSGEAAE